MAAPTRSDFCTLDTKFGTILKSVAYNLNLTWTVRLGYGTVRRTCVHTIRGYDGDVIYRYQYGDSDSDSDSDSRGMSVDKYRTRSK